MLWTKRQDVAFSGYWLSSEQEALKIAFLGLRLVFLLTLLHGAVVVGEYECVLIVWVLVALGASVFWAEVAGWVVGWEGGFGGGLLLSSGCCVSEG